ncbi:MAG TPA: hypothetical protein VFG20_09215 [Planctomycetaceae bacterium]|nr:hypothetical protein [Planctomycetaceae bacterium]
MTLLLSRLGLAGLVCFTLSTLIGCGGSDRPPLGKVSGAVTIDGAPLTGVIVAFMPAEGRPATAVTDDRGLYRLEYTDGVPGAKVGPATVSFFPPTGGSPSHAIPAKYSNNSTEFKVEIKPGSNTFNFDLKSEGAPPKKSPTGKKPVSLD